MSEDLDVSDVAGALRVSLGLLVRRLRQIKAEGELTLPESSALARLDRGGPTTSGALARLEQISPQSMGATLAALEARDLLDPAARSHGRAARGHLRHRRRAGRSCATAGTRAPSGWPEPCPRAFRKLSCSSSWSAAPLIERLAQTV